MANTPSTNYAVGDEFETSYGRKYTILGGPWGDNAAVWYAVLDQTDTLVGLQTERRLEGMTRKAAE